MDYPIGIGKSVSSLLGPQWLYQSMNAMNVSYGSKIFLQHPATRGFLKSVEKNYIHPAGSGQQIVGADTQSNADAVWLVKGPDGTDEKYKYGMPVYQGDVIRLEHVATRKNLHSHSLKSPLTGQQEVTAFSKLAGVGDGNDNWNVELEAPGEWKVGVSMRLDFRGTGCVLHSHSGYSHPALTAGLQEVTAFPRGDTNDLWQATLVPGHAKSARLREVKRIRKAVRASKPSIEIFISHSAKDSKLATALIKMIRAALDLKQAEIRCSSVHSYKFPLAGRIDELIKKEVAECRAFIALVTPDSLNSPYVLFEMGARWGQKRYLASLIACGARKKFLKTPAGALVANFAENETELHQFLIDLANHLGKSLNTTPAFLEELKFLQRISKRGTKTRARRA